VLGHFRRYSREQLASVAESAGFRIHRILTFNRAGSPAWWLNGKILKRTTFGLFQIKILNLLVPIFKRTEKWPPLPALSLIAVPEKPTASPDPRNDIGEMSAEKAGAEDVHSEL